MIQNINSVVKVTQVCHTGFEESRELLKYLLFYNKLYGVYNRCVTLCVLFQHMWEKLVKI